MFQERLQECAQRYSFQLPEWISVPEERLLHVVRENVSDAQVAAISLLATPLGFNRRLVYSLSIFQQVLPGIKAELAQFIDLEEDSPLWNFFLVVAAQIICDRNYADRHPGTITGDRPAA